ncbi:hypothetical protein AX16_004385 [Volvariella volvacea WC 439]|nr:hypothetical protein AX16_004385 [Volvariella volvacea WC 439]
MFARVTPVLVFILFALPLLAAATVVPRTDGSQCNTGSTQCCNSVQDAKSPLTSTLAGLLGIVLGPITGQVGINCTPIDIIGVGGNSCTTQPVCCTGNNYNGLLVVGCTPLNVNL